jgi:hypothetical protein
MEYFVATHQELFFRMSCRLCMQRPPAALSRPLLGGIRRNDTAKALLAPIM